MNKFLILGGNSGIGEAVARLIRNDGPMVHVMVHSPTKQDVNVALSYRVEPYIRDNGPFDYIVYSAGINNLQWIKDFHEDDGRNMKVTFNVNAAGFVNLASHHMHYWPDHKVSAVVVSSDAAELPMRGSLAYCVSKAALDMAVKVMARELAPLWRVNAVAPGMVEGTNMTKYIDETIPGFRGWTPEYAREYEKSSVPSGRRATLEEVAETIRWVLLGPEQMTGAIVKINGGKS
jgi:NAD(P)-dependent dehydrogenase (short-subunit alcohol dehydrogenase family)